RRSRRRASALPARAGGTEPIPQAAGGGRGARSALPLERYAHDIGVKDHGAADKSLHAKDRLAAVQPRGLGDQQQTVPRAHETAKADVVQAAEADKTALHEALRDRVIGAE